MKAQTRTAVLFVFLAIARVTHAIDDAVYVPPAINTSISPGLLETVVFHVDPDGNQYFGAKYNTATDFNPFVGIDEKNTLLSESLYVTRLNSDGTYAWTQTLHASNSSNLITKIVVSDGVVFVAGHFSGTLQISSGTPLPSFLNLSGFVAALSATSGAAVTTFGQDLGGGVRNGIQTFSCMTTAFVSDLVADATSLYVTGTFGGNSFVVGQSGNSVSPVASEDAFLVKLSKSSGSLDATFNTATPLRFGSTGSDRGDALAVNGTTLYVTGLLGAANPQSSAGSITFTQPDTASTVYVLALNANSAVPVTSFGGDGLQILSASTNLTSKAIAADLSGVWLLGNFSGSALGIGASGTIASLGGFDCYVAKLDAAGAAATTFSGDGILRLGTAGEDFPGNLVLNNGSLFVSMSFGLVTPTSIDNSLTLESGEKAISNGFNDALVMALDAATSATLKTFSGDGLFPFGSALSEINIGVGVTADRVFLAGFNNGFDDSVAVNSVFMLPIPRATGVVDWTVVSTKSTDSTKETLITAMTKVRSGGTVRFDANVFDLSNSFASTVINLDNPLQPLRDGNITLDASDRRVTVNGANSSGDGIQILSDANVIKGLSLIGFTGSGISILGSGANRPKNNIIGGDRAVGTGPNGNGLRIADCGSFGIRISAADSNKVIGAWLGVDPSGQALQPNLAGVLIEAGAKDNIIGSTLAGEKNVISANSFEGVTVSDVGSDGTKILGNFIGVAAVESVAARSAESRADDGLINGRANVSNGASGVFLSKGTQANTVGGTNAGEDNTVGFNGGSGIEVRAVASRKNSSKGNRIARNKSGGIKLFDGSNNNIAAPTFDGVDRLPSRFSRTVNATVRVRGSAASPDGSVVEVFRDRGDQGEQLIGRANCAAGKWQVEGELLPDDNVTATVTDPDGNTSSFALFGRVPDSVSGTPVVIGMLAIQATVGVPLNYRIAATGSPTDYDALSLPAGLIVNNSTGVISGTPTVSGTFSVDLAASNANGTGAAILTLTIGALPVGSPLIQKPLSATGLVGGAFSFTITIASGASNPVYAAANLPPGLSLDTATGVISGTPTSAGVFAVLVSASNSLGQSSTSATFTILAGISSNADSDGDGVSDALEMLAQTDSLDASSKPTVAAQALGVSKTTLSLSFTSAKDKLKTVLSAPSSAPATSVGVLIGGIFERVSLDAKGKGVSGAITVSAKSKNGTLALTVSVANTDLEPALGALGFSNRTTTGKFEAIALPVALQIVTANGSTVQQGQVTLNYKATAGKTGKASQAK